MRTTSARRHASCELGFLAVVLTEHLSHPGHAFRRLCDQDVQGLIQRKAGKRSRTKQTAPSTAATPIQRRLKPEQADKLVEEYRNGSTVRELATSFDIHRQTVYEHLKSRGVPLRQRGLSPEEVEEAAKLYEEGWSLARLGEKHGITSNTMNRTLRKAGVEIRARNGWPPKLYRVGQSILGRGSD